MDELEKTMPDDVWRKAFEDAAEIPPLRVWNAIEHRLDESDGARIIPLWATGLVSIKPVAWSMGLAASVALVWVGWWLLSTPFNTHATVVAHQKTVKALNKGVASASVNTPDNETASLTEQSIAATGPGNRAIPPIATEQRTSLNATMPSDNAVARASWAAAQQSLSEPRVATTSGSYQSVRLAKTDVSSTTNGRLVSALLVNTSHSATNSLADQAVSRVVFESITGRSSVYSSRFGSIDRIVWYQPTESSVAPEAVKTKRKSRDVWASASVMPGTYNPIVSVHTASVFASNVSNYVTIDAAKNNSQNNSASQSISSRPNFSMAYQASAGVQLNDRWSIESGVGYLVGRSTVETPTQLAVASFASTTARTSATGTLYADILRSGASVDQTQSSAIMSSAYTSTMPLANQTVYSGQTRQTVTNDYQFVQVPVQMGYQLRPRKRLSLALLGGFITNIFVRNTVGDALVVTQKDGIYKPVTLAAVMGARFRYRPSRQWSASFAGIYQPSLGLGTSADSPVQTHPTTAGMSVGVDYHF